MNPREYRDNPNVRAFLRAIRFGEGTSDADGYRRLVGGGEFGSFHDHPRERRYIERYKVWSTAAGAYQFIAGTWDEMRKLYALPDFSPESQDLAAIGLIHRRGALQDVLAGRIEQAIAKCAKEWASLPGSPYGQRTVALARVIQEYTTHGGQLEAAPIVESKPTWEAPMDPFTAATIGALVKEIPGLIRSFGSDGKVTERNAKAAEILIGSVTAAAGAKSGQEAVEVIRSSPEVRAQVTERLQSEGWFETTEAGGGGIEGARAFSKNAIAKGDEFWRMGVFWVTLALLPLLYGTVYLVLVGPPEAFSGELRAAIASSVVTGVLGGVIGFWLGLKFSAPKADAIALGR